MSFHVETIYLAKQAKRDVEKKLCFEMRIVTKSNLERNFKTKKVCRFFANFSSEQEHFTYDMYMAALIRPSDVKN